MTSPINSDTTLAELVGIWLGRLRAEGRLEGTTINEYERVLRKLVVPALGHVPVSELTTDGVNEVLARLDSEGCARYVVTDVNKDGMLQGPNLDLLTNVCAVTDRPVVASGGITELADLEALIDLVPVGVEGAIIGTALYEGRFTLEEALQLTWPERFA